jgi:abortive infection bacteriophage resistance protein
MGMDYDKPHLTYADQVAKMQQRGIVCPDQDAAIGLVEMVGYYRLSAYIYPFRELLPPDQRQKVSRAHFRAEEIRCDTHVSDIESLWRFDRKLRLKCLDALETVEVGLRTRLAYVLGRRDVFGHVHRESLEPDSCDEPSKRPALGAHHAPADRFDEWIERYRKLESDAKNEDYVVHHRGKYGGELPIWIAVEFLDFGALARLFQLLRKVDQNEIASAMGVKGGPLLGRWLRDLNYLRNLCAHHSRLWNRTLTYKAGNFNKTQVGEDLQHVASGGSREKLYVPIACLAYLTRRISPRSTWPLDLRSHVKKFPVIEGISPGRDMGFVEGWESLPLWSAVPAKG